MKYLYTRLDKAFNDCHLVVLERELKDRIRIYVLV